MVNIFIAIITICSVEFACKVPCDTKTYYTDLHETIMT